MGSGKPKHYDLFVGQCFHNTRGRADDQASWLKYLPFGNQCASPDDALGADHRTIEDAGPHPDQSLIFDRATMQDRLVADGYPRANGQWCARIGMTDGPILEIAVVPENDGRVVGPDHGTEPDTGSGAQSYVADQVSRRSNPGAFRQAGRCSIDFVEWHAPRLATNPEPANRENYRGFGRNVFVPPPNQVRLRTAQIRGTAVDNHGRRAERVPLRADIDFRRTGEHRWRVNILDFSPEGCRVELPVRVLVDDMIWISLPGIEALQGRICWVKEWIAGVEFERPMHPAVFGMVEERMRRGE